MPEIAAFDVDRTLTVRDCVVPFMTTVAGRARLASAVLARPVSVARWSARGARDDLKAHMVDRIFRGRSVDEVSETGALFAHAVVSGWMRGDTMARLRWHQERGDIVLLVSASLDAYLDPLGDLLEVDGVLCTRLAARDGVHDGTLDGPNCRGPEKVVRIRRWLEAAGLGDTTLTWAYGDSRGDREMLASALRPLLVGRTDVTREGEAP